MVAPSPPYIFIWPTIHGSSRIYCALRMNADGTSTNLVSSMAIASGTLERCRKLAMEKAPGLPVVVEEEIRGALKWPGS